MANSTTNNTEINKCSQFKVEGYQYFILLSTMPFHGLLIKVLTNDLEFRLPRHIIMFSLSVSDLVLPLFLCISDFIVTVSDSGTDTPLCHAMRGIFLFTSVLSMVVSSLGIIAMSVERYIACIHSFHIYRILTHKRVVYGSIIQWMIAIILAITELLVNNVSRMKSTTNGLAVQLPFIAFSFATAIPVCVIQARLFFFATKKLKQDNPAGAFGAKLELADYLKKHVKVAIVSGIVALGFIFCMLPTASLFLYEIIYDTEASESARRVCFSLTLANCLVDPFIYGIGIADTRKMVLRNLKKIRQYIFIKILPSTAETQAFTV